MKIGLTGGTGFIGQWLLKLYADSHEFVVLSSGSNTDQYFHHPQVSYHTADYTCSSMEQAFVGCDVLVNLGAALSTKEREEWLLSYEMNIASSENLFLAAKNLGISNVVNISSRTVYDQTQEPPYTESTLPAPMNDYAIAKLAVEHLALRYNKRFHMKIKTLRLAQIFGPGGRNGYMMEIFREKSESGQQLTVFDLQGKELLYVKDAAAAILSACMKPQLEGVYNIGSGIFHTNAEIAETFCRVYENAAGYAYAENAATSGPARKAYMDVSKARTDLQFEAAYSLEDAIRDIRSEYANTSY